MVEGPVLGGAATTVLVTGFEPFDGADTNNSWDAVALLEGVDGIEVARLPVEFARATEVLDAVIADISPALVIAVGLAENRTAITPERIAINVADARIPDNAGDQPVDAPLVPGGPDGILSRLPVKAIVAAVQEAGIPAAVSDTAGTYVCNAVMYRLLQGHPGLPGGFIHVPLGSVLAPEVVAEALRIAVDVTLDAVAAGRA